MKELYNIALIEGDKNEYKDVLLRGSMTESPKDGVGVHGSSSRRRSILTYKDS